MTHIHQASLHQQLQMSKPSLQMERGCLKALRLQHLHSRAVQDLRRLREKPIDYSVLDPRLFDDGSWMTGLGGEGGKVCGIVSNGGSPLADGASRGGFQRLYWLGERSSSSDGGGVIEVYRDDGVSVVLGDVNMARSVDIYTSPSTFFQSIPTNSIGSFKDPCSTRESLSVRQTDDVHRLHNAYPQLSSFHISNLNKQVVICIPAPEPGNFKQDIIKSPHPRAPHIQTRGCNENCQIINNQYSTHAPHPSHHHIIKYTQHTSPNTYTSHNKSTHLQQPPQLHDQPQDKSPSVHQFTIHPNPYQAYYSHLRKVQKVLPSKRKHYSWRHTLAERKRAESKARTLAESHQRQKRRLRRQMMCERLRGEPGGRVVMDWRWWRVCGRGSVLKREIYC